ncbi:MFS transporter [Intrasporangium sp. YIM S08009]|uniref:MFS transporter n=1 Tax=Intrasporangium zincisolvens TaxID=3080018 RepID=UPI002B05AB53|nr:MFS transporter [Intrasporangium sp. YIM S08009]
MATTSGHTDSPASDTARPRFALPALCATQVIGWGVLYYAFPVMLPSITRDTGWSAPAATASFSAALVVSALAGIAVGHIIDRTGPRRVMAIGSVLGALAMTLVATAPTLLAFAVGWLLAGPAMAATFYQPAFAAITRWYGSRRVRALTTLTLAGGLASTIFAPITAALTEHLGWRHAALTLAVIVLLTATPLHALALRGPWPTHASDQSGDSVAARPGPARLPGPRPDPRSVIRSRPFLTLAFALTLSGFAMYAVVFGLIPLLTHRGATTAQAAWALGLGGLGQTLGRLVYAPLAARSAPRTRTAALIAAGGLTTALLAAVPGPLWLLTLVAMLAGTVRGNLTLLQATAVTDRWGIRAYGRLTATLAAPVTVAGALAPWAGAALMGPSGGYTQLFWVLATLSGLAAVAASLDRPARA